MNIKIIGSMDLTTPDLTVTDSIGKATYTEVVTTTGSKIVDAHISFWSNLTSYTNNEDNIMFNTVVKPLYTFELSVEEIAGASVEQLTYQKIAESIGIQTGNTVVVENI